MRLNIVILITCLTVLSEAQKSEVRSKLYTFTSFTGIEGLFVSIRFTEYKNDSLEMNCVIETDTSAYTTLEMFYLSSYNNKPEIYLIKNHTDCNDLTSIDPSEEILAEKIATADNPSKCRYIYSFPFIFKETVIISKL